MAMTYDIGPPKDIEPDWEETRIDAVAKRILDGLPDGLVPTVIRGICHAYQECNADLGSGSCRPVKFLGADDGNGMSYECTIRDTEDEHGNLAGPLIEGSIDLYTTGIEISANSALLSGLPASMTAKDLRGTPITGLIDMPLFNGRMIEDVKTAGDNVLLSLARQEPLSWMENMEGWE